MAELHTHDKAQYPRRYGKLVQVWARPMPSSKKGYREPVLILEKRFKTVAEAKAEEMKYDETVRH